VELRIHDNGQGIVLENMTSMRFEGHGLGLLGMRERTELLGGSFVIDTGPQEGTTVTVTLPLQAQEGNV
jgi:signal transduction histidine kinase